MDENKGVPTHDPLVQRLDKGAAILSELQFVHKGTIAIEYVT